MAIIPWRRSDQRWPAEREGDPFSYLRQQVNRVFDDFGAPPRWHVARAGVGLRRRWT